MASEYIFQLGESSGLIKNRQSIAHLTGGKAFPSWISDKKIPSTEAKKEHVRLELLAVATLVGLYLLLR